MVFANNPGCVERRLIKKKSTYCWKSKQIVSDKFALPLLRNPNSSEARKLTGFASRMTFILAFCLATGVANAEPVQPIGVVELFTSQGCNSCPPADEAFAQLAGDEKVVALAYHIDYWDYLGWRDTLARPENTRRQLDYGRAFGVRSVYTPQAVINGRTHMNGAQRASIMETLVSLKSSGQGLSVPVHVVDDKESITIEVGAGSKSSKAHVLLVYFDAAKAVTIDRGENTGSHVTYWNAVTSTQFAGVWHGAPAAFELPTNDVNRREGCVVLLQSVGVDGLPGPIIGAATVRKPHMQAARKDE